MPTSRLPGRDDREPHREQMEAPHHQKSHQAALALQRAHEVDRRPFAKSADDKSRELESDGIVHRNDYQSNPPRVEYSLASLGMKLKGTLDQMALFGDYYKTQIRQERPAGAINEWRFGREKSPTRHRASGYQIEFGDPAGNRTRDSTLRGLRLSRLTTGPCPEKFDLFSGALSYANRAHFASAWRPDPSR